MSNTTTEKTILQIRPTSKLLSDNGLQFVPTEIEEFLKHNGVKHQIAKYGPDLILYAQIKRIMSVPSKLLRRHGLPPGPKIQNSRLVAKFWSGTEEIHLLAWSQKLWPSIQVLYPEIYFWILLEHGDIQSTWNLNQPVMRRQQICQSPVQALFCLFFSTGLPDSQRDNPTPDTDSSPIEQDLHQILWNWLRISQNQLWSKHNIRYGNSSQ